SRDDWFDHSDFAPSHPLYSEANKKVPGKFKDEYPHDEIAEFVGLRAKMYSISLVGGKEKARCKGVKRCVIEQEIKHLDFLKMLHSVGANERHSFRTFQSKNHQVYTTYVNKIS